MKDQSQREKLAALSSHPIPEKVRMALKRLDEGDSNGGDCAILGAALKAVLSSKTEVERALLLKEYAAQVCGCWKCCWAPVPDGSRCRGDCGPARAKALSAAEAKPCGFPNRHENSSFPNGCPDCAEPNR